MNRLLCLLLLPTVLATFASAQQSVHHYSVAGDVASPQTYQFDAWQKVSVRDALNHAGIGEAHGKAVILRRSPLHVAAVYPVHPEMPGTSSLLSPGDIVVFRSTSGFIPNQANALVLIHSVPDVLPLDDTPRSLNSLLQQVQLSPQRTISVTRTAWGTPSTVPLPGTEYIQHGDVVDLSGLVPAGTRTEQLYAIAPVALESSEQYEAGEQDDSPVLDAAYSASQADDRELAGSLLPITRSVPIAQSAPDVQMELEIVESETAENSNGNPFRVASMIGTAPSPATPAAAPDSGVELHSDSAGSTILNSIFIAGLLFAMGLIFIGWLRTKHEREAEGLIPGFIQQSLNSEAARGSDTANDINEDASILAIGDDNADANGEEFRSPEQPAAKATTSDPEPPGTADESEHVAVSPDTTAMDSMDTPLKSLKDWFAGEPILSETVAESHAETTMADADEVGVTSHRGNSLEDMAHTEQREQPQPIPDDEWKNLEDLIQNRLPIEMKQAELPLRVSLFGRPAGPQRLRIDAAHTQIAPPHVLSSKHESKNRRPTTAVPNVRRPQADSADSVGGRDSADTDLSRLDKALNFLEEQSDS